MDSKTKRQLEIVNKWKLNNNIGTLIGVTGFGKTYTSILAIKDLNPENIIIVVPTLVLQQQWKSELDKHQIKNYRVYVINTASKTRLNCDLLIIDECHTVPATTFSEVFNTIKYNKLLCLTATIERTDGGEELILSKAPIIDTVTLDECLSNNWISPYQVYNLACPFTPEELAKYSKADNAFRYYAMQLGYGDSFKTAQEYMKSGTSQQKAQAAAYYNSMRKRKELITNNSNKLGLTLDIINKFPELYTIVFSESIKFADSIQESIPDISVSIHSKMTKKEQKDAMKVFKDGRTKKRVIASCKALTAGLDLPKLSLGIVSSFNSSKLVSTQSLGRLVRLQDNKKAIIVNLYTPDTQEVNWLNTKQFGQTNIKWITSIDEII